MLGHIICYIIIIIFFFREESESFLAELKWDWEVSFFCFRLVFNFSMLLFDGLGCLLKIFKIGANKEVTIIEHLSDNIVYENTFPKFL